MELYHHAANKSQIIFEQFLSKKAGKGKHVRKLPLPQNCNLFRFHIAFLPRYLLLHTV